MTLRWLWLSRDGTGVRREVVPPVRVADIPGPAMSPRPQLRLPAVDEIWGVGAATVVNPRPEFDPCGAPPIAAGNRKRRA